MRAHATQAGVKESPVTTVVLRPSGVRSVALTPPFAVRCSSATNASSPVLNRLPPKVSWSSVKRTRDPILAAVLGVSHPGGGGGTRPAK